jgi:hypothetical protein
MLDLIRLHEDFHRKQAEMQAVPSNDAAFSKAGWQYSRFF